MNGAAHLGAAPFINVDDERNYGEIVFLSAP
jgi:hypothetical protein